MRKAHIIRPGQAPEVIELPTTGDPSLFVGRWFITNVELWSDDVIHEFSPAELVIETDGLGSMRFIAVECDLDVIDCERDGRPAIEWSWHGWDDGHETSGRGWASLTDQGTLKGRIYFHRGDASDFAAELAPA